MENFLRFATALKRVTGSDDGLLTHPAVRNCLNMIRVGLTNDGAMHGVNDTVPTPVGGNVAWFAGGPLGLWYGDHAWHKKAPAYRPTLFDMLVYRPVAPSPRTTPKLPVAFALRSIEYGILRSHPCWDAPLVAGLKGSRPPYTHHNQPDTGALWVDIRGERLLIDPGYYKEQPTDHCLPLINGRGPIRPGGWTGKIIACRSHGALRHLAVDATAAYQGAADRVARHLVMVGDEGLVVLDDIVAGGEVTAQYQCGGVTRRLTATRFEVAGRAARLRVELVGAAARTLHPERDLHDTHWGYHFATCRWFPVTAIYRPGTDHPLVTLLMDESAEPKGRVSLERFDRSLVVSWPSGRRVIFRHESGRWRLMVGK